MPETLPAMVKDAVRYLLARLTDDDKAALKAMRRDELIRLHRGYGMGVRNGLGLWGQNPALMRDPEIAGKFPDAASMYIIEQMWDVLHAPDDSADSSPPP